MSSQRIKNDKKFCEMTKNSCDHIRCVLVCFVFFLSFFFFQLTTHKPQPYRDLAVEALTCLTPSVVWILSGTAGSLVGVQKTGGTEANPRSVHNCCSSYQAAVWEWRRTRSRGAGVAAWEFAAVVVPKNIQPARTKCSWTTTLTGKLSSFGLDPRRSSNFSFCLLVLNTRTQSDYACRGNGQASLTNCCLNSSNSLFEVDAREWRDTNQIGFLDREEACRSVFKLDHH